MNECLHNAISVRKCQYASLISAIQNRKIKESSSLLCEYHSLDPPLDPPLLWHVWKPNLTAFPHADISNLMLPYFFFIFDIKAVR